MTERTGVAFHAVRDGSSHSQEHNLSRMSVLPRLLLYLMAIVSVPSVRLRNMNTTI